MNNHPLSKLVIRSAVVRGKNLGQILACDLKKEREETPHALIFKWQAGSFVESWANFDAHSICCISVPEPALVFIAPPGEYAVFSKGGGSKAGDIIRQSQPRPKNARHGGFRSVIDIEGKAYAVGLRGMVYRFDRMNKWTRIDEGLQDSFEIEAVHGIKQTDIYAVGDDGESWRYNGRKWTQVDLPTNKNLNMVKCCADGNVYIAGDDGVLIRGRGQAWEVLDQEQNTDDLWDIEWFKGHLYASAMSGVFRLNGNELEEVDFGEDRPKSTYQLSAAKGVMWSNGEHDIMSFDGKSWTRIV